MATARLYRTRCAERVLRVASRGAALAWVVLAGCGVHLHNPADETLARKASDDFHAADVGSFVSKERAVIQAANQRDLAATRHSVAVERDAVVIAALSEEETAADLLGEIMRRRQSIGLDAHEKELHGLPSLLRQAMQARDAYLVAILSSSKPIDAPSFPPVEADSKAAQDAGGAIWGIFQAYDKLSVRYETNLEALSKLQSGVIGQLNNELVDADAINLQVKTDLDAATQALKRAVDEYENAAGGSATSAKDLEEAEKKLAAALGAFDKIDPTLEQKAKEAHLEDLLASFPLEKLKTSRDEIGKFLDAFSAELAQGSSPGGSATTAEGFGKTAAALAGSAQEIRESSTHAMLVPLLFEKERLQIEMDRLTRKAERGRKRVDLIEAERDQAVAEGMKLLSAESSLKQASAGNPRQKMATLLEGSQRGEALRSIFLLSESIGIQRLRREEIEVALITLDQDEALDASEFALQLWSHAIATPLDELVQYHASGIKPEDIAQLIQALSLAGTAVGVNR